MILTLLQICFIDMAVGSLDNETVNLVPGRLKMNQPVDMSIFCITDWTPGLHKLCHPTILDGSTWSKFGARGEHGDVFLFRNLGLI